MSDEGEGEGSVAREEARVARQADATVVHAEVRSLGLERDGGLGKNRAGSPTGHVHHGDTQHLLTAEEPAVIGGSHPLQRKFSLRLTDIDLLSMSAAYA